MLYGSSKYYCNAWLEPNLGQILSSSGRVGLQEVGDPGEYNTFLNSRPPSMELSAIQLVVDICRETRVPCHIGRWQGYMGTLIDESESDEVSRMVKGRRIYGNWLMKIVAVHLSAASALPMVKAAKAEGLPLTVETCHHYLRSIIIRLTMSYASD